MAADLIRQAVNRTIADQVAHIAAGGPKKRRRQRSDDSPLDCCGHWRLPAIPIVTNNELADRLDTSDEWITTRTGIRQRHVAADGELTSDLGVAAARRALNDASMTASDIDLLVVATSTPDETFPATATIIQRELGMTRGAAFDVQAVCTGFVYALATADNFVKVGQAETALVIGAETFSRILDWADRSTCVLFGGRRGALQCCVQRMAKAQPTTVVSSQRTLHADGRHHDLLFVDGGPSTTGTSGHLRMEGREVFRHGVEKMAAVVEEALAATGLPATAVDWFIPHQANKRIIDGTSRKLGLAAGPCRRDNRPAR